MSEVKIHQGAANQAQRLASAQRKLSHVEVRPRAYPAGLPTPPYLYIGLHGREFDETNTIVPVGSESWPSLDTGHYLAYTPDWKRIMTIP